MNITKEDIYGYIGSLFFCVILLLILWFSVLKTSIPIKTTGVLVNFGNINEASGMFEPMNTGDVNNNSPVEMDIPETSEPPAPQVAVTQNMEQTISIEEENKKKEEDRLRQELLSKEQEEQRRRQAISNQVAGAFGSRNTQSSGQGTGLGNQGSPQGNPNQSTNTEVGGYGDFSLAGRSLGPDGLPHPSYSVQIEGIIVIDITVDKNGNVIAAMIGRGTTISDLTLRQSAQEAAGKAKFNTISGNENQSGTITYRYYLK